MIDLADALLVQVLRDELKLDSADTTTVQIVSPADPKGAKLGLFLYAVQESPAQRNEPRRATSPRETERAPLVLDLRYLVTAYDEDLAASHLRLANAARALSDRAIVRGAALVPGSAADPRRFPPDHELRITADALSLEDMTRLWGAFPNLAYRLSLGYVVTPVPVPSLDVRSERRVAEREDHARVGVGDGR